MAGVIKEATKGNETTHVMAHAVCGAIAASAKGNDALAGAATAGGLAPYIQKQLYGSKDSSELSEQEKQTITALSTIAAGMAGGVAGGDFSGATAGAETGKNATENNWFDPGQGGFGKGTADTANHAKYLVECQSKDLCGMTQEEYDKVLSDAISGKQKVPYDPGNTYVILWTQTGPTLASIILAPELAVGGYLSAILSGAWFSGSISSTEQLIATGDIDPNKLAKDAAIGGALGGTGKVVTDVGGKGVSYIFGKGVTESTVGSSNKLTVGSNANSWSMITDAEAGASDIIYYGRVQIRINLPVGDGKSGWEHVMNRHFSGKENASQFSISQQELKGILQSKEVVKSPISRVINSNNGLRYERVITLNKNIGYDKFSGGKATSTITILTDKFGNLVTVTPGRIK